MNPRKKMTTKSYQGHETLRPLKNAINSTTERSACAAEGVEEAEEAKVTEVSNQMRAYYDTLPVHRNVAEM